MEKNKINKILDILEETYPEAECALDHMNVFQLIVAVALSAQTTDKSVNLVTPALFNAYPDAFALGAASPEDVSEYIKRIRMILFGRETRGLPRDFIAEHAEMAIRIPMSESTRLRSFNLANSANIILFEALRQLGFPGLK